MHVAAQHILRFLKALFLGGAVMFFASSCNSLKKVPQDESLLVANKAKVSGKGIVTKSDMLHMVVQEPNSRFFGARVKLSFYNWAKDDKDNWWNNRLRRIGEEPAIFDSGLIASSQERILSLANSKGYFSPTLTTEVRRKGKDKRKVAVSYELQLGEPYHLRDIRLHVNDDSLTDRFLHWNKETLLKSGMQYQVSVLDKERTRITEQLQNEGYWAFNKDFINYQIDSSVGGRQMDVDLYVRRLVSPFVDSLTGEPIRLSHKRYRIGDVYIQPQSRSQILEQTPVFDTILFENISRRKKRKGKSGAEYYILNQGKPIIRYKPIIQKTFLESGDYYALRNERKTYDNLSDLRVFQYTDISLREKPYDTSKSFYENNLLDCHIRMLQGSRFGFSVEGQITTTSGIQGIAVGMSFQNRNTFGGGEILSLRVRGVYELQATVDPEKNKTFLNTFEAKAEVSLEFPRFLVPGGMSWTSKHFRPSSIISLSYSYQQKRDYSRGIFNATFGYHWRDGYTDQTFNPLEASAVQMLQTSSGFQATLDEYRRTQNYRLLYQYSNHFILTPHYQFVFNNYKADEAKDFEHFALDLEVAGSLLYGITRAIYGKPSSSAAGYEIFGLPFSQYAKIEADYRHHFVFGKRTELVFRGAVGLGYSYGNSQALPYEKSMFIGGNSTLRAWPLYQLGPGIYALPEGKTDFERLGDVMLVFNLEQRFPIVSGLRGAVFLDLGNIWMVRPNEALPGGEFKFTEFYKQFAFGTGFGLRYDFKFFLIRVDVGIPLRDPSLLSTGENTWVIRHLRWRNLLFNFGIGYPF